MLLWHNIINDDVAQAEADMEFGRDVLLETDPFQVSDQKFVQLFPVDKPLCQDIVDIVTPYIPNPSRTSALSIQTKVGEWLCCSN